MCGDLVEGSRVDCYDNGPAFQYYAPEGWHYGWKSARGKHKMLHRVSAMVFELATDPSSSSITGSNRGGTVRCVAILHSSPFQVISQRRALKVGHVSSSSSEQMEEARLIAGVIAALTEVPITSHPISASHRKRSSCELDSDDDDFSCSIESAPSSSSFARCPHVGKRRRSSGDSVASEFAAFGITEDSAESTEDFLLDLGIKRTLGNQRKSAIDCLQLLEELTLPSLASSTTSNEEHKPGVEDRCRDYFATAV
jgi:hypothetical protein